MGEDLEIIDVDVRQRKSGKSKNPNDDIVTSVGGGGGSDGGHGSSKRRRRGRGAGDRSELIRVIPEEETPNDPKERKGKIVITKKPESDGVGDEGDDAYDSSLEDEESSGSWLVKLIIITIIVSLGFSLLWLNDGSSSTDLGEMDSDLGSLNDIGDSYIPENGEDTVRGDIDEANQGYQESQEHQQWNHEFDGSRSDRVEIIAEVSETIGEPSSQVDDEPEYQNQEESRDEGYFVNEQPVADQEPVEPTIWTNRQNYQRENQPEDQFTSFQEPELVNPNQQPDHDYTQQSWQYQEQIEHRQQHQYHQRVEEQIIEQKVQQLDQQPEQAQPREHRSDEQLVQSFFQMDQEIVETRENEPVVEERYYECPEGSYWDGLSCVNPESFVQLDHFNNVDEKKQENIEGNIFYPEHQ